MDHANSLFMGSDTQRRKRQDRSSNEIDRYRDKLINEREAIHRGMGEGGTHHHYFSILPKYSYYSLSLLNKHANEILSCLLTAGEP